MKLKDRFPFADQVEDKLHGNDIRRNGYDRRKKWESRIKKKLLKRGERIYEIYSGFGTS